MDRPWPSQIDEVLTRNRARTIRASPLIERGVWRRGGQAEVEGGGVRPPPRQPTTPFMPMAEINIITDP
jgi:hypothetical protein